MMRGSTVLQERIAKDNYSNLAAADGLFTGKLAMHGYSNLDLDAKRKNEKGKQNSRCV